MSNCCYYPLDLFWLKTLPFNVDVFPTMTRSVWRLRSCNESGMSMRYTAVVTADQQISRKRPSAPFHNIRIVDTHLLSGSIIDCKEMETFSSNKKAHNAGAVVSTHASWLYIVYCSAVHLVVFNSYLQHEWKNALTLLDYSEKNPTFYNLIGFYEARCAGTTIIEIRYSEELIPRRGWKSPQKTI